MQVKDITQKWVKEHFDLDKERGYDDVRYVEEFLDFEDFSVAEFQEYVERRLFEFCKEHDVVVEDLSIVWDEIDEDSSFSDMAYCLQVTKQITETDQEVIKRLQKREKDRIRRELKKNFKQDPDYKVYKRLQKKFNKLEEEETNGWPEGN